MDIKSLKDKISFSPEGPVKIPLYDHAGKKSAVLCMEPGQSIGPQKGLETALLVIDGEGSFTANGENREAGKGVLIVYAPNEEYGIAAKTRLVVLTVTSEG